MLLNSLAHDKHFVVSSSAAKHWLPFSGIDFDYYDLFYFFIYFSSSSLSDADHGVRRGNEFLHIAAWSISHCFCHHVDMMIFSDNVWFGFSKRSYALTRA